MRDRCRGPPGGPEPRVRPPGVGGRPTDPHGGPDHLRDQRGDRSGGQGIARLRRRGKSLSPRHGSASRPRTRRDPDPGPLRGLLDRSRDGPRGRGRDGATAEDRQPRPGHGVGRPRRPAGGGSGRRAGGRGGGRDGRGARGLLDGRRLRESVRAGARGALPRVDGSTVRRRSLDSRADRACGGSPLPQRGGGEEPRGLDRGDRREPARPRDRLPLRLRPGCDPP